MLEKIHELKRLKRVILNEIHSEDKLHQPKGENEEIS
tara:strand:+ start:1474 stop:1584 length:111 start_codon:yes stop_codon:yes gene_type:complete